MIKDRCPRCGGNLFIEFGIKHIVPMEVKCLQCSYARELSKEEKESLLEVSK